MSSIRYAQTEAWRSARRSPCLIGRTARLFCFFALALSFALSHEGRAQAATLPAGFAETQIAAGLSNPTAMAFAPDGRLFVCLQGGQLRVIKNGALLATPFLTVPVDATGERGLLGVAFDPNFATNQFVYLYYTVNTTPRHNRVSRFTANGDVALAGSETLILQLENLTATNHNGGALHFGPDGKLYVAVGENAVASNSQTLANRLGKMLRVNPDGTIPPDNPFFNTATGDNRSIWALGLRNPFTFAFQPGTGRLFINDVGQSAFEEIDDGIAGANYGWPTCEGACGNPNFRDPVFAYGRTPQATGGCAITGGAFYNPAATQFPGEYAGKYFFADLCSGWIRVLDTSSFAASSFATGISQPVDLKVGPEGSLYYLARGSGAVYRINYTASPAPPTLQLSSANFSAAENAGSVEIIVTLTGVASGTVTVDYATSDGAATERADYTTALGTLTFAPGETSKSVFVLLIDNLRVDGARAFNFALSNPTGGATLGTPGTATITINDDDIASSADNPIDAARYFVRQNYLDFLNRAPDEAGLDFWANQIAACESLPAAERPPCRELRRVNVSAAFFLSIEFQETGFLVYRLYRAGFGRIPRYREFMRDTQEIARGVVVGVGDWQQRLNENQQAYIENFVTRAEFTARFPGSSAPEEYVNTLSGDVLTQAERDALAHGLRQGTETRATVLRQVVANGSFARVHTNSAFVLMEYFGYLRRNPDDAPDTDFGGYDFWLAKLVSAGGDYNAAQMVASFLLSIEYRARFGQP